MIIIVVIIAASTPWWIKLLGFAIASIFLFWVALVFITAGVAFGIELLGLTNEFQKIFFEIGLSPLWGYIGIGLFLTIKIIARKN